MTDLMDIIRGRRSVRRYRGKEIPEYEVLALIPVGYPAKDSAEPKRREIKEFVHYERF
jgi:nitroreductase